jgi:hypothetical protein
MFVTYKLQVGFGLYDLFVFLYYKYLELPLVIAWSVLVAVKTEACMSYWKPDANMQGSRDLHLSHQPNMIQQ